MIVFGKALEIDSSENIMDEIQKLSSYDLLVGWLSRWSPSKSIRLFGYYELLLCGQASTQLRAISNDASLL